MDMRLDSRQGFPQGDPLVNGVPGIVRDSPLLLLLRPRSFGDILAEIRKDFMYPRGLPGWSKLKPRTLPKVALVLTPVRDVEEPQEHVVAGVVSEAPDGHIPELTAFCPENLTHPGPHLPTLVDHDPGPTILLPWETAQEEVTGHVLQPSVC